MTARPFWDRVEIGEPDDCWIWTAATTSGYGRLWSKGRMVYAHRLAYEMSVGEIPDGLEVCHSCDTPLCVNPAHLWLGTHRENMQDMGRKGRMTSRRRILSDDNVRDIRQRHQAGETARELADAFGVHRVTVYNIVNGQSRLRAGVAS
jgi:hypothetical protein